MKISGSNRLTAPADEVWKAMLDPAVLARSLPGCESLTTTGPDEYAMRVTMGVAAIRGTYDGEVAITDKNEPDSLRLKATGSGAPGTIDAVVDVRLAEADGGGTALSYDADATVGGTIGGVGQRMLAGVTRKTAAQFFSALDAEIAGSPLRPDSSRTAIATSSADTGITPSTSQLLPTSSDMATAQPQTGQVYAGRAAAKANATFAMEGAAGFALGTLVGGLLVGVGVLIGARLGRRDR
ncbi:MAG: carbon monoxide dehydrogenase subunit G [Intrasporangiaceae bacterium]|nr:carbon monoxide dehydrogenase subunit G [Intrasporangiaceae bacterium]